jgi:hypothetical protein
LLLPVLLLPPWAKVHDGEEFNTVAAGEELGITVTFSNPLNIKLALSKVRLLVHFTPPGSAAGADIIDVTAAESALAAAPPRPDEVQVVESQFSLHPGECHNCYNYCTLLPVICPRRETSCQSIN